jgi:segregation and condensation protein B
VSAPALVNAEPEPLPETPQTETTAPIDAEQAAVAGEPSEVGGNPEVSTEADNGPSEPRENVASLEFAEVHAAVSEPTPTDAERSEIAGEPCEVGDNPSVSTEADKGADEVHQLFIVEPQNSGQTDEAKLKAVLEAAIYVTEEPLALAQIAAAIQQPVDVVKRILAELTHDYAQEDRGLTIREVAGGFKMATKPEHHEAIRTFVKNLKPPLKLSLPALETLAVIAYKQPITAPEIMEIRGVQGAGVLKTLLDRKLIATAGRKQVVGKPILYKTTKEFLLQFGLKDLSELPTLKEFEELGRMAMSDPEPPASGKAEA